MSLTPQQEAAAEAIGANAPVVVSAVAGSGKTTTIVAGLQRTPPERRVLACAFNVAIKKTLEQRLASNQNVICKTLNGIGHSMWQRHIRKGLVVDADKLAKLAKTMDLGPLYSNVLGLARAARLSGLRPLGFDFGQSLVPDDFETWEELAFNADLEHDETDVDMARQLLLKSHQLSLSGTIDFDDQIAMPVLFQARNYDFQQVVVDESQDLNPLQHALLSQFVGAKFQVVGDPRQSIYGFRGAVSDSMGHLAKRFSLQSLPLTVCFRCSQLVVREAQAYAPEIQSHFSSPAGLVAKRDEWDLDTIPDSAAVLCRYNAPLVKLAMLLIRARRKPDFQGRDIGKGMAALVRKIDRGQPLPITEFGQRLYTWQNDQTDLALAKNQESKAAAINDKADSVFALMEEPGLRTSADLQRHIQSFFAKSAGGTVLSSIHRAKGLEWNSVYWLEPASSPGKWAYKAHAKGNPEPLRQEQNLKYVATTRAITNLTYLGPLDEAKHVASSDTFDPIQEVLDGRGYS